MEAEKSGDLDHDELLDAQAIHDAPLCHPSRRSIKSPSPAVKLAEVAEALGENIAHHAERLC